MPTNLPIRSIRPLYRQCIFRHTATRPFSSAPQRQKQTRPDPTRLQVQANQIDHKAPGTMMAEGYASGEALAEDFGLFPGTFIRGSPPSLVPEHATSAGAWWTALKTRLWYEKTFLKTRASDYFSRFHYRYRMKEGGFRKPLKFRKRLFMQAAKERYRNMYMAFAAKDTKKIEDTCISGLASHFRSRIESRPKNVMMKWMLSESAGLGNTPFLGRFLPSSSFKIVSNRASPIPSPDGKFDEAAPTAVRQVIVRIRSRQLLLVEREGTGLDVFMERNSKPSLANLAWTPDTVEDEQATAKERPAQRHEKAVTEYVVLQQRMLKGKEEDWKVWGFTKPSTVASLKKDEAYQEEVAAYEAAHPSVA